MIKISFFKDQIPNPRGGMQSQQIKNLKSMGSMIFFSLFYIRHQVWKNGSYIYNLIKKFSKLKKKNSSIAT